MGLNGVAGGCHRVSITASNLIVDRLVVDDNPVDSSLTVDMLERQKALYGKHPIKLALDDGETSKNYLNKAKEKQIKDVCLTKKRGLKVEEMFCSQWISGRVVEALTWISRKIFYPSKKNSRIESTAQALTITVKSSRVYRKIN